jgi:phage shock protein E
VKAYLNLLNVCKNRFENEGRNMKSLFQRITRGAYKAAFIALIFTTSLAMAQNKAWLDVRTTDEYNTGHVAGAIHIPHGEIGDRIADLISDKNTLIHVYCRSGNRAGIALQVMKKMGYTNAHNDGGFSALKHESATE